MTRPPNLLFIMCDQLRHDWLGCAGATHARTPNIDAIAARGTRFTQACTNSPVCAPARIGLATALRPHRLGALDNHAFLPLSRPTYYQRLRDIGYHVGCTGKLDLAKPDGWNGSEGRRPLTYSWGFTHPLECEGKLHAGRGDPPNGPYTTWIHRTRPDLHAAFTADYRRRRGGGAAGDLAESAVPLGYCEDDYIGRRACDAIRAYGGEFPWHHFVSFVGPHDPYDPASEFAERWREAPMPDAIPCEPAGRPDRYRYGRKIVDQADRTYIVFSSDHGEMLGDHGRWTKSCQYESALRIPLIVAGPGLRTGVSAAPVELIDVAATLCDLSGAGIMPGTDGLSLLPILQGHRDSLRTCTIATHRGVHAIRTPRWKLIIGEEGRHELFDLVADPTERHDLAAAEPAMVATLHGRFIAEGWIEGGSHR